MNRAQRVHLRIYRRDTFEINVITVPFQMPRLSNTEDSKRSLHDDASGACACFRLNLLKTCRSNKNRFSWNKKRESLRQTCGTFHFHSYAFKCDFLKLFFYFFFIVIIIFISRSTNRGKVVDNKFSAPFFIGFHRDFIFDYTFPWQFCFFKCFYKIIVARVNL